MENSALPMTIDPVCGMRVEPGPDTPYFDHEGTRFYFCQQVCQNKFQEDPGAYLKPKGRWRRYLDRLARANEKDFGLSGPKCCG